MDARRWGALVAGAAATTAALVLVAGDGADVGAGAGRAAPTPPSARTVDNPITGAGVADAVYHGTTAPIAVVVGATDGPVTGVVLAT